MIFAEKYVTAGGHSLQFAAKSGLKFSIQLDIPRSTLRFAPGNISHVEYGPGAE